MPRRIRIARAVLLIAVVGVVAWLMLRPKGREPVYQGKGLRTWLWEYALDGNTNAQYAVRQIDPEAAAKAGVK